MREVHTVKPVLSGHSKIDKTKVLKTGGRLLQVESITECSSGAFCNTFDLPKRLSVLKTYFWGLLLSGHYRHILLYTSSAEPFIHSC